VATLERDNMATRQRGKRDRVRGSSCVPAVRCCACDAHVAIDCVLSYCMQRALHKLTFTCGVRSGLDLSEHAFVCGMTSTVRGCAGVLAIAEASTASTDACMINRRSINHCSNTLQLYCVFPRECQSGHHPIREAERWCGADAVLDGWCQGCSCRHGRCTNLHAL
jgi:hypothetical protein